jgi:hypothetical protein
MTVLWRDAGIKTVAPASGDSSLTLGMTGLWRDMGKERSFACGKASLLSTNIKNTLSFLNEVTIYRDEMRNLHPIIKWYYTAIELIRSALSEKSRNNFSILDSLVKKSMQHHL